MVDRKPHHTEPDNTHEPYQEEQDIYDRSKLRHSGNRISRKGEIIMFGTGLPEFIVIFLVLAMLAETLIGIILLGNVEDRTIDHKNSRKQIRVLS